MPAEERTTPRTASPPRLPQQPTTIAPHREPVGGATPPNIILTISVAGGLLRPPFPRWACALDLTSGPGSTGGLSTQYASSARRANARGPYAAHSGPGEVPSDQTATPPSSTDGGRVPPAPELGFHPGPLRA
ncbi:hypothetical protein C8Q77DRAFT_1270344, partial [Trametes polyzona]